MHADRAMIEAAAQRLRGQLVQTPMIGEPLIPGRELPPGTRIKAEFLQVGGSALYRGICHYLLRSLGRHKGVVFDLPAGDLLGAALAARQHRLPCAAPGQDLDADLSGILAAAGMELLDAEVELTAFARGRGYAGFPGIGDPAVQLGLATLGMELAAELPLDGGEVLCVEDPLLDAVELGLEGAGCRAALRRIPAAPIDPGLPALLRGSLKICPAPEGLAALDALREADGCVLLLR